MVNTHFKLDFLEDSTIKLKSIAHPIRIAIIDLLYANQQMTVTEIYMELGIEQAVASHHLQILKSKGGIVKVRREGKNSYYFLTDNKYYTIVESLAQSA